MPRRSFALKWPVVALLLATATACAPSPDRSPEPSSTTAGPSPSGAPASTPPPAAGHEVFGFVPYWEMDAGITAHLRTTMLTTLALFSVTNTRAGAIDTTQTGYRRITGAVGQQMIREAHARGTRVELVFSSFGLERNTAFFTREDLQDATIASLVALVGTLGLDGVNVDVEALDPDLVPAYGAFVGRLRGAVIAADASDHVSVATTANLVGAALAAAAAGAGADRIFLMGYDYRVAGSAPGATAPIDRRDGEDKDLAWSLDLYGALGVPVERTILGLPLYGMSWPVSGPELGAPQTGRGEAWILRQHLDVLLDPAIVPVRDEVEMVELYVLDGKGAPLRPSSPPASASASAGSAAASPAGPGAAPPVGPWPRPRRRRPRHRRRRRRPDPGGRSTSNSPETLAAKLALATGRGLAGAGFWAIGYERGLPGYTELIARFAAGEPMP